MPYPILLVLGGLALSFLPVVPVVPLPPGAIHNAGAELAGRARARRHRAPPDAVAAIAIAHRLRLPRRIVTILEGASLVNDATGLILYRGAVAAALGGTFDGSRMLGDFAIALVGAAGHRARHRHTDALGAAPNHRSERHRLFQE